MKFMHGAGHERELRAGTENIMQIAGLGIITVICVNCCLYNSQGRRAK